MRVVIALVPCGVWRGARARPDVREGGVWTWIAEQAGHPISFGQFFKVGFPFMLITVAVATVYVLVVYGVIGWTGGGS